MGNTKVRKDNQILIKVNHAFKERLEKLTKKRGMGITEIILSLLDEEMRREGIWKRKF